MIAVHDLWLFAVSGLLLAITPGPDTMYIVGRTTAQGTRAGVIAALGVGAGILIHTVAAAIGISALLAASAAAFLLLKVIGAAYLVYIGLSLLWSSRRPVEGGAARIQRASLAVVFRQGFLSNVLNPKVALFFVAFLPQFVDVNASNPAMSLLFLGVLFNVIGTLWNVALACAAAVVTAPLRRRPAVGAWFHRSVGAFFVYIGIRLALEDRADP